VISIDRNLYCHLQKLAGVHSSETFQFLQFSPYVSLGLANKSGVDHLLVFSGSRSKGSVQMEGLTQTLIELAGTLIWPLEDLPCFAYVHGLFPSLLHAPSNAS
jgi:hypothetical protein